MTLDTKSFDLFRSLPLSPERLFALLTEAKYRDKWSAPDADTPVETVSSDLRVRGEDRQRCGPADDPTFEVITRWYHLSARERAVCTETPIFGGEAACTSFVTYNLMPEGRAQRLVLRSRSRHSPAPKPCPKSCKAGKAHWKI